jgi:tRNA A37 methylthiotransferase MiaB
MNMNDTEIVWSVLQSAGYSKTDNVKDADVILMMTCAIREKAETKVWNKLQHYTALKRHRAEQKSKSSVKIGVLGMFPFHRKLIFFLSFNRVQLIQEMRFVLGCMAERLKHKLVEKEKSIDVVCGPDSYKDLPRLLAITNTNQTAVNVVLSLDETYADVVPVRLNQDSVSAYV